MIVVQTVIGGLLSVAAASSSAPWAPTPADTAESSKSQLHRAIDALSCVDFQWSQTEGGAGLAKYGAIKVPVQVGKRTYSFQLDTGSDFTKIYGKEAVTRGWARTGDRFAKLPGLTIGKRKIGPTLALVREDWPDGGGLLGLDALVNHFTIIDYPRRRLCIVTPVEMPQTLLAQAKLSWASLRGTKLYVPVRLDGAVVSNIFFDTGASATYLDVEQEAWKRVTGIADLDRAPKQFETRTWSGLERMVSGPVKGKLDLAGVELAIPYVDTWRDNPNYYQRTFPTPTAGFFGNAALLDQIIILDLTPAVRFGIFPTSKP